jgi:hypothetical protein
MHAFRTAVESGDLHGVEALLAEDIVFSSPVVHHPYHGRDVTATILRAVIQVFEDFRYEREIDSGADTALIFRARIGDRELQGVDLIHTDEQGLIDEFVVMVRPLSGAHALRDAMAAKLEQAFKS